MEHDIASTWTHPPLSPGVNSLCYCISTRIGKIVLGGQIGYMGKNPKWDILPTIDRLLLFTQANTEHEVLVSKSDRFAITMWLYSDEPSTFVLSRFLKSCEAIAHPSIFVSIASYRDPDVANTVMSVFHKASFAERLTVGVLLQDDEADDTLGDTETRFPFKDQLRIQRMSHIDAKGPAYARSLICNRLFNDEAYFLQLDSHMRLGDGWDSKVLQLLLDSPCPKSVISFYPTQFDRNLASMPPPPYGPMIMREGDLDDDGMPRIIGTLAFPGPSPRKWG
ncbi:GlcNAc-domain-containing protein [Chytridium lagenaria]|nr:GlcNAc-domain-containing protein [Chytridium lagenaria]